MYALYALSNTVLPVARHMRIIDLGIVQSSWGCNRCVVRVLDFLLDIFYERGGLGICRYMH